MGDTKYIPAFSRLQSGSTLSTKKVIESKYLAKKKDVFGYYSCYTFANMLGRSTQVPAGHEVVSNNASANRREVELGGRKLILRKPRAEVRADNAVTLQLLDLLKDLDRYSELDSNEQISKLQSYVKKQNVPMSKVDRYLLLFPERVYKSIYETELYNVFTCIYMKIPSCSERSLST